MSVFAQSVITRVATTYRSKQNRQRSKHRQHKNKSHNKRRTLGIRLKDMMNLRQLSISLRIGGRNRHIGVAVNRKLESDVAIRLRAPKRPKDNLCIDWMRGPEELDRQILLGLQHVSFE